MVGVSTWRFCSPRLIFQVSSNISFSSLLLCRYVWNSWHRLVPDTFYYLLPLVFWSLSCTYWPSLGLWPYGKSTYLDLGLDDVRSLVIIRLHCVKFLYWYYNYINCYKNTELFTNGFLKSIQIIWGTGKWYSNSKIFILY